MKLNKNKLDIKQNINGKGKDCKFENNRALLFLYLFVGRKPQSWMNKCPKNIILEDFPKSGRKILKLNMKIIIIWIIIFTNKNW